MKTVGKVDTLVIVDMDGSALTNIGNHGLGGLVRNHEGNFCFGIYEIMGVRSIERVTC